jgi:hypothetical protein
MTDLFARHRAVENANASLHSAGLPTVDDILHAVALMLENSGNVHANSCTLFHTQRCNCALGAARGVLSQYRDAV